MEELDDLIPGTNMTYMERIELAVGDGRGVFSISDELDAVNGGRAYAKERIKFWKTWNESYAGSHKDMNTQERFIAAQKASKVYASAVQKSILTLICGEILQRGIRETERCFSEMRELFWLFSGGSLLIMSEPCLAARSVARKIKSYNFNMGFQLEMKFEKATNDSMRNWIIRNGR